MLPKLTTVIPAPLVAIVVLTAVTIGLGWSVPAVGDQGELPASVPALLLPHVPLTTHTLAIIAPYAFAMALVGLLESLMTARLVDDITDTHSNKTREALGQGAANIVTGLFGGMGGCAMIGQTMINVKISGARTRISTFSAGSLLRALVVGLGGLVAKIPMAALVAVMITVSVATLDWHSVKPKTLRHMPKSETFVMLSTVAVTVATDNLAYGVAVGTMAAMVLFARRVAHLTDVVEIAHPDDDTRAYAVKGELFFASSNDLVYQFDYTADSAYVVIDMSAAHIWDASSVATLDTIAEKFKSRGKTVTLVGMNDHSAERHAQLSGLLAGAH